MKKIKEVVKKFIPKKYRKSVIKWGNLIFDGYATKSYSQKGEDMILRGMFGEMDRTIGFYVDVGAYHPMRFSNTYYFYKRGWRGINIDTMPGSMKLFKKIRTRDINLETAISDKKQILTYYLFSEPALNTFSKELAVQRGEKEGCKIIDEIKIETSTLVGILDIYLPKDTEIDFLSVDVEGLDLQVLKSNDWDKYSPSYILAECLVDSFSLEQVIDNELTQYLRSKGYELFAKTLNTLFFKRL